MQAWIGGAGLQHQRVGHAVEHAHVVAQTRADLGLVERIMQAGIELGEPWQRAPDLRSQVVARCI